MRTRTYPWLLPAVLILFLTQVVLFPFAMGFTYAGRNESPHHVLTYTTGSLTWNSATGVDPDTGVAELSLFSDHYQNVQSDNGEKVVAPGTENTNIVRLKNSVKAILFCYGQTAGQRCGRDLFLDIQERGSLSEGLYL